MRRIVLFLLVLILFVAALNIIALPIPYSTARSFDSPLVTPVRPTPTGWPDAPFPWETPAAAQAGARPVVYLPVVGR